MALTLTVDCSNHQQEDGTFKQAEIPLDTINERTAKQVAKELTRQGWVVQFNGDHMDTY